MAYAFNKVDDYFRRNKTGQQGSLEKGNMGAPAPTAAAENLAKTAETSGQQGNSETGQFRAAKNANTSAIQGSLTQPATQQVQNWTTSETAKAGDVTKAGEGQIAKTYTPYNAEDIGKAERGEANPLTQQVNYSGKELTFNPYQVQMPAIETQQQLAGGVSGMQAALQKQKGGRYTAGMGALDASVLAGSNQGMQGVRSALGGLQQGARETQQNLQKTDENLAAKALATGTGTRDTVKKAIQDRIGGIKTETLAGLRARGDQLSQQNRASFMPSFGMEGSSNPVMDALRENLRAQGLAENDVTDRMGYAGNIDPNQFVVQSGTKTISETPQSYTNLAAILGIAPEALSQSYGTYALDPTQLAQATSGINQRWQGAQDQQAQAAEQARLAQVEADRLAAEEAEKNKQWRGSDR
jgi:hypothetical protein